MHAFEFLRRQSLADRGEIERLAAGHAVRSAGRRQRRQHFHMYTRIGDAVGGKYFEGERLQRVAGEDRHRFAEDDVAGRTAAAQRIVVHRGQIVMDQRIGVDDFDRRRARIESIQRCAERAAGRIDEHRSQPFAAAEHRVAHRAMQFFRRLVFRRKNARQHACRHAR